MDNTGIMLINCPPMWARLGHLGIASIKSYLKSRNIDAQTLDLNQLIFAKMPAHIQKIWEIPVFPDFSAKLWDYLKYNFPDLLNEYLGIILNADSRYLGFSIWHSNKYFSNMIVSEIRKRHPEKIIVYGGPEITLAYNSNPDFAKNRLFPADFFVAGEGEKAVEKIIRGKNNGNTVCFDEIDDLDAIPAAEFNTEITLQYPREKTYPVWMSRGCIRKCRFCAEHTLHKTFRTKSPSIMVEQLRKYHIEEGIDNFVFYDSLINGDLDAFEEFLDLMARPSLRLNWESQILIRKDMPGRLFKKIKDSGCYNLFIGLESGCNRILKLMRKGFDAQTASDFMFNLSDHKIHFEISLIAGFPGETESDFEQTLDFLAQNSCYIPKIAQINPFISLAGAPINEMPDETFPAQIAVSIIENRIEKILALCRQKNIRYTKSYINNLVGNNSGFDHISGRIIPRCI